MRLRMFFLHGGPFCDIGAKQNDRFVELRMRYYF
jgi:hypothetical protein